MAKKMKKFKTSLYLNTALRYAVKQSARNAEISQNEWVRRAIIKDLRRGKGVIYKTKKIKIKVIKIKK